MSSRYGLWLENFPRAYWDKIKALKEHYNLSTRQVLALGIRCTLDLASRSPDTVQAHVEVVRVDVSSKPGRRPTSALREAHVRGGELAILPGTRS